MFHIQQNFNRSNSNSMLKISFSALSALILAMSFLLAVHQQASADNQQSEQQPDSLTMMYAEPWLNKSADTIDISLSPSLTSTLDYLYAQPWLEKQANNLVTNQSHHDPLAMMYAQPWLEKIEDEATINLSGGDPLSEMYAAPWLAQQKIEICNQSLDMMYACQNGFIPTNFGASN